MTSTLPLELHSKFFYYSHKYGLLHTVMSYVGRHSMPIWKVVGSWVTSSYIRKWLSTSQHHILNLGGGSNCLEGCLTADIDPRADVYVDITKPLPFPDSSIDAIFCEEVIEHISLEAGRSLLKECWRTLKPGGVLRLTTPDLNYFAKQAVTSPSFCDEINDIFYNHGHRYLYTQEALHLACRETGFVNFKESTYHAPESCLGYLDSHAERFNLPPETSQYLEIQKPK